MRFIVRGRWSLAVALGLLFALGGPRSAVAQTARQWTTVRTMMVEAEVAAAGIRNRAVLAAMRSIPRHEFVPAEMKPYSYFDMSLPIGEQQTISTPFVVAWMTQQLDPKPTDRVLEIGTGSGYQAAILSRLVQQVYTIEILPALAERAQQTLERLQLDNIKCKLGDGYQGWADEGPFDKIIVTCSPESVPQPLVDQLREGGRIVAPLGERYQQTLCCLVKRDGKLVIESREPTYFVPMTGQADAQRDEHDHVALTPLANGDFEELMQPDKLSVWYYVRQARLESSGPVPSAPQCVVFRNQVPGRSSQALQAIGVDGRQVAELVVELWVKADKVAPGQSDDQRARVLVSFFDENRAPLGQQSVGPWTGSFDWQRRSAHLKVPPPARIAIVCVGLLGATGELACDQLVVRMANARTAAR